MKTVHRIIKNIKHTRHHTYMVAERITVIRTVIRQQTLQQAAVSSEGAKNQEQNVASFSASTTDEELFPLLRHLTIIHVQSSMFNLIDITILLLQHVGRDAS